MLQTAKVQPIRTAGKHRLNLSFLGGHPPIDDISMARTGAAAAACYGIATTSHSKRSACVAGSESAIPTQMGTLAGNGMLDDVSLLAGRTKPPR